MPYPATEFSEFDDLIADQGDVAIVIEMDPDTHGHFYISAYMPFTSTSPSSQDISYSYLTACDPSFLKTDLATSTSRNHKQISLPYWGGYGKLLSLKLPLAYNCQ